MESSRKSSYWKENLKLLGICLTMWFFVSFVCGILLVDKLNQIHLGGYPLGFWFAQQGSIYVFIGLIFYYAKKVDELDRKYHFEEADECVGESDSEKRGK